MSNSDLCLCGSGIKQQDCCDPYIKGKKSPPTAEALMRSRYVAYATGNDEYLLETWHSSTRPKDTSPTAGGVQWIGLQILSTELGSETDNEGIVEFRARCRIDDTAAGLDERSDFVREDGRWYYVDGTAIQPQRTRDTRVGRNDPCPCGSGVKFKKCCGAA